MGHIDDYTGTPDDYIQPGFRTVRDGEFSWIIADR